MTRQFLTPIVLPGAPTSDLEAATKKYVDDNAGGGGGGKSYVTLPALKPPDTADADDVEFLDHANGSDTVTDVGMSWGNPNADMTADIKGGILRLTSRWSTGSTVQISGLFVPAPSGSFNVTTMVDAYFGRGGGTDDDPGIAVALLWGTLATPTAIVIAGSGLNDGTPQLYRVQRWSDYTTFAANHGNPNGYSNGLSLLAKVSWDSAAGEAVGQVGHGVWPDLYEGSTDTSQSTDPDYAGVVIISRGGLAVDALWRFLRFNWTPDFDPTTDD